MNPIVTKLKQAQTALAEHASAVPSVEVNFVRGKQLLDEALGEIDAIEGRASEIADAAAAGAAVSAPAGEPTQAAAPAASS